MRRLLNNSKNFKSIWKSIFSIKKNANQSVPPLELDNFSQPAFIVSKSSGLVLKSNVLFQEYCQNKCLSEQIDYDLIQKESYPDKIINIYSDNNFSGYIINYVACDQGLNNFVAVFDSVPIAEVLLDPKGKVIRCNEAFIKFVDNKKYASIGWNFNQLVDKSQHGKLEEIINDLNNKLHNTYDLEIKIVNNAEKICIVFFTALLATNGQSNILVHLIDVTDHRNLEVNFAHSQKIQALGQLAGGIAHDFNNLLTAMLGFCDLLLLRHLPGDPSFAEAVQIKQNINRAITLVRQLLSFSRKQVINAQQINANVILAEIANLISRLVDSNINLEMKYDENLKNIKIDQGQFEQVLINLAVNARDSMPNGGTLKIESKNIIIDANNNFYKGLITPCGHEYVEDGEYVLITVADTGTGIDKKHIGKIFEPFFSTKESGAGIGLGLATVYGIIKHTGGCLFLETKENVGTKFYILFKALSEDSSETLSLPQNSEEANIIVSDLSGSGVILIVEDEESVRTVSSYALKGKGYQIIEAANGSEAFDIIKEKKGMMDLIIVDVIMPHVNGPDLIKEVHKIYPNIKVIFMSGYSEHALANDIENNPKIQFLAKPFSLKELVLKVKEVLMVEA